MYLTSYACGIQNSVRLVSVNKKFLFHVRPFRSVACRSIRVAIRVARVLALSDDPLRASRCKEAHCVFMTRVTVHGGAGEIAALLKEPGEFERRCDDTKARVEPSSYLDVHCTLQTVKLDA